MTKRAAVLALFTLLGAPPATHPGSLGYDPSRDPRADLRAAVAEAQAGGRRILMVVGGDWCSWCHILDRFLEEDEEIRSRWKRCFVTLKIHHGSEITNEEFLSRYPAIEGYPHIFVLDADGTLLHSQNTALLESGKSYCRERMREFLDHWAPPPRDDAR